MSRETIYKATITVRQGEEEAVEDTQAAIEAAIRGVGVDEVVVAVDSFHEYVQTTRQDMRSILIRMKEARLDAGQFEEYLERALELTEEIPA